MYMTGWIAMRSSPSSDSTTTTRFWISPMRRMPTLGWLMIAPPKRLPLRPGFETLKVAPLKSSIVILPLFARLAELRGFVEIDLGDRDDVRRSELRVRHVVGGDAAPPCERDDLIAVVLLVRGDLERAEADARNRRNEPATRVDQLRELRGSHR